jgi:hypothetical protein
MEMPVVWKEEEKKKPFPSLPTPPWKARKQPRASHIPTAAATTWFPFSPSSFNFNFDEKCYLHARYLLLPTCPFAHIRRLTALAAEVRFSRLTGQSHLFRV